MTSPVVPLQQLVLKVHSRCDLACRHCYVYEHADQSWASRPRVISEDIVSRTARRLAEHAEAHGLASVQVILHGGEPLLTGPTRLRFVCEQLRAALHGVSDLDLRIHTNGLQLTERYLDLFAEYDVRVGISLDGDRAANDRHRLYRDGRSSHDRTLAAIGRLRQDRYRHLFAGLLCTVDVRNDPVAVYDALARLQPPRIDFLLPHATWDAPPLRPEGPDTPYADWLLAVHDRWTEQGCPMPVRLFDSVISTLGGGPARTESLGLEPADVVVIETDGTYEQADSLKTSYDGAPVTGKNVFEHSLDEVSRHPGMTARRRGIDGLSTLCRRCPVVRSCGGGLYAHRYRGDDSGFDNPSVYCADLKRLVEALGDRTGIDIRRPLDGFDALADGTDDGTAVIALVEVRQGVTLGLLKELNTALRHSDRKVWDPAWQLALDLQAHDAVRLAALLVHPFTRSWAVRCLDGAASPDHLASLVAATVLPTGMVDAVEVPVTNGFVELPGVGRLHHEGVRGTVRLTPGDLSGSRWEPVRRLKLGQLELALDDIDPYRDCFDAPVKSRLPDHDAALWREVLPRAWDVIARTLPGVAAGMATGLRVLTPLAAPPGCRPVAAGSGFAALGLHLEVGGSHATEPARVAADLVRGFRLGLLDVLLDECELYDERDTRTGVLLADVYARVATDALFGIPSAAGTGAKWRALSESDALTVLGRRFVDGMGRSL
ncbi:FxsB family cyclophane-forming radical SAM/SPASM peptide maturase [Streptomyces sp. NPDC086777]|uniref:FxsB family cyclophane-forming radical SAM/SPASM peptide maturase n=1 Tax=Streptomyces sp. NPDC086777 TaxID=3154866 RepID=UPI00344EED40